MTNVNAQAFFQIVSAWIRLSWKSWGGPNTLAYLERLYHELLDWAENEQTLAYFAKLFHKLIDYAENDKK